MPRLGVLGWPVAHSRSPRMHRAALAHLGLTEWSYQHLPAPPELFPDVVAGLPGAGFAGANVTIPHKETALALATEPSAAARAIGAANTLTFQDGAVLAENTDAPGLLDALGLDVSGRSSLVLGAGGSARAAIHALLGAGADVAVWNRTRARAEAVVRDLGGRVVEGPVPADVLVNCTAAGLHDHSSTFKELPFEADALGTYPVVVDLVYTGIEDTALIAAARERGSRVVDGLEVLVHQGARSLELWTGLPAPIDVMRAAARATPQER